MEVKTHKMEKKVGLQREEGFFSSSQCQKLTGRKLQNQRFLGKVA
jgi:hypothetical protein